MIAGYLESAATLGRRTAELHVALATSGGDGAFAPDAVSPPWLRALTKALQEHAARVFDRIEPQLARLPADTAAQARALVALRGRADAVFEQVTRVAGPFSLIRVHGDYHLGQVLWAENDYFIIDFEGEPARPLAERRAKQPALRDVAGMLRSFGYAAYAGLTAHAVSRPDDFARLEPWARAWQTWVSGAFLAAYFDAAGRPVFLPADAAETERLLEAFVLDKALYELVYELDNRPDWVRIPLWSLLRHLGGTI